MNSTVPTNGPTEYENESPETSPNVASTAGALPLSHLIPVPPES